MVKQTRDAECSTKLQINTALPTFHPPPHHFEASNTHDESTPPPPSPPPHPRLASLVLMAVSGISKTIINKTSKQKLLRKEENEPLSPPKHKTPAALALMADKMDSRHNAQSTEKPNQKQQKHKTITHVYRLLRLRHTTAVRHTYRIIATAARLSRASQQFDTTVCHNTPKHSTMTSATAYCYCYYYDGCYSTNCRTGGQQRWSRRRASAPLKRRQPEFRLASQPAHDQQTRTKNGSTHLSINWRTTEYRSGR